MRDFAFEQGYALRVAIAAEPGANNALGEPGIASGSHSPHARADAESTIEPNDLVRLSPGFTP